jgi:hypothetical protein
MASRLPITIDSRLLKSCAMPPVAASLIPSTLENSSSISSKTLLVMLDRDV